MIFTTVEIDFYHRGIDFSHIPLQKLIFFLPPWSFLVFFFFFFFPGVNSINQVEIQMYLHLI